LAEMTADTVYARGETLGARVCYSNQGLFSERTRSG